MNESTANATGLVGWVAASRKRAGIVLAVLAAAVGGFVAWLASTYGRDYLAVEILLGLLAALFAAFAVIFAYRPASAGSPRDEALALVLAVGGLAGFVIALVGLVLMYQWWGSLMDWLRDGKRDGAKYVLPALAVMLAGLVIMFVSVQSARGDVRQSAVLRRLVYGYNAVLTGILLFLILAVANVLAYIRLPAVLDSSESSFSKLSERSENILKAIDKPVHVTMVMSTDSFAYSEMRPLLANAQSFAPQMTVDAVQPIRGTPKYEELVRDYPQATSTGILIVVGDDKKTQQVGFVPGRDIIKGSQEKPTFEGEGAFITELNFLAEDKKKPVLYFTSNNADELEFQEGGGNNQDSVSGLVRRLKERNFDVKPLKFDVADAKVPDDATVVVVAGPRKTFPKPAADAIRNYLEARKGKLIALFPPTSLPGQKAMPDTGLEAALASLKVEVTKERILTFPDQDDRVELTSSYFGLPRDSRSASTPVAQALRGVRFLPFVDTRVVRLAQGGGPGPQADVLLQVVPGLPVLLESDMTVQPAQLFEALKKQGRDAMQARVQQTPPPMAVTVSEAAPMPSPHGMPPQPGGASKPRAVVFGSSWWVGNGLMDDRQPMPYYFNLFAGAVDWLREKPANIGFESKQYKSYSMSPDAGVGRLLLLPPLFVLVGIIGLGAGVWVARRR